MSTEADPKDSDAFRAFLRKECVLLGLVLLSVAGIVVTALNVQLPLEPHGITGYLGFGLILLSFVSSIYTTYCLMRGMARIMLLAQHPGALFEELKSDRDVQGWILRGTAGVAVFLGSVCVFMVLSALLG